MLIPDLFHRSWVDAQAAAATTLAFQQPQTVQSVFGIVLRETYYDVLAITGAVLLHWFATKLQPSPATAQMAILASCRFRGQAVKLIRPFVRTQPG
jgi:hypothetical protein